MKMLGRSRTMPSRLHPDVVTNKQIGNVTHYLQIDRQPNEEQPDTEALNPETNDPNNHVERTGTIWTATSHIITAVIGSGVLSLAWAVAQLGWIAGPVVMILFALINLYTATLLCHCYRTGNPVTGQRNQTYMEAVKSILGGKKFAMCGLIQYLNLFGTSIGYTIAASVSMMAINRSNCFHKYGKDAPCHMSSNGYMITFGITEIIFSQIPNFHQVWWLSIVAAIMSFTYSGVGVTLGIAQVAENGNFKGSLTGIRVGMETHAGTVTPIRKLWRGLQAFGAIAFAYTFSVILIEIQDTLRTPPAEYKTMQKATIASIITTTIFYVLCGAFGYAAFGDLAPTNLLTGFGFYNPYWLLDIANLAIVIHLVGAYQVLCQPLFAFVEKWCKQRWPKTDFITHEHYEIVIPFYGIFRVNFFRLIWRTVFVILTTVIAMLLPFFNDVVGILGAFGFWPLTVYFPIEMYIKQKKITRWSSKWIGFQMLSFLCLLVSVAAAIGSFAGVVSDLKSYRPFKTSY